MYVVTGATGNTGRVVAESLLAAGKDVQVVSRSEDRLRPLVEKGAKPFVGSLEDAQALAIAFSGALGVYTLLPPTYHADKFRSYQRELGESIAAAIHESGVEYVVNLSSVGAQHASGTGPVSGLHEQEARLSALKGVNVLHLRAAFFMENFLQSVGTIRGLGALSLPLRGDVPMAMITTRDIGRLAAERLLALDFEGSSTRELLGPRDATLAEVARVLGAAIGRPDLEYVQVPYADAETAMVRMGMSPDAAAVMSELHRAINEGLVVPTEPRSGLSSTPTTLEEFATLFAQAYAAAGG
jgi:uncharacterized protein YbjT (DUF2867 family)